MTKKVTKKKAGDSDAAKVKKKANKTPVKAVKAVKAVKKVAKKSAKKRTVSKKNNVSTTRKVAKKKVSRNTASESTATDPYRPAAKKLKTYLKKSELDHFRSLLIEKLKEITGDVDHMENEFLKKSRLDATGDLSSMPIHMADIGSDNYEQEFSLGLVNNERKIVQEVLWAIKRIEEKTYGMCEGTGEPIPKARLEAFPWARYSVKYAEMIEKGQAFEVRNDDNDGLSHGRYASFGPDGDDEPWQDNEITEDGYDADEGMAIDDDDDDPDDEPFYN